MAFSIAAMCCFFQNENKWISRGEKQKQGDFDVVLTRWGPDYADPTTYLNLMVTGNAYNYGNYSNPDYDALMQQAAEADGQARWDLLHAAEDKLMQDSPVIGLFQVGGATLVKQGVTGIESLIAETIKYIINSTIYSNEINRIVIKLIRL